MAAGVGGCLSALIWSGRWLALLLLLGLPLLVLLCRQLLVLRISRPLRLFTRSMGTIADTEDMSARLYWPENGEFRSLAQRCNQMLDRLQESQQRLLAAKMFSDDILLALPGLLFVVDADGRVARINKSVADTLELSPGEILGRPFSLFCPDHMRLRWGGSQGIMVFETILLGRHGALPMEMSSVVLRSGNEQQRESRILICSDLREKKAIEVQEQRTREKLQQTREELAQTEKLAIVGQMAGSFAHEVLNPMTSITVRLGHDMARLREEQRYYPAGTQLINRLREQISAPELREGLDTLAELCTTLENRQRQLVDDLAFIDKQVSRIIKVVDGVRGMVKSDRHLERIEMATLLDDILEESGDRIVGRQVKIRREYGDGFAVQGEAMELYSIFSNVIKNGLEAMPPQAGRENCLTLRLSREGQRGEVRVIDNGVGMDSATQEKVFAMGFTTKGRAGTGIGLNIARKLVLQYSGTIMVGASAPGMGTTMVIQLPLAC